MLMSHKMGVWVWVCPELPTRVLIFRVFLRGLALLDAPVPLPVFVLYLLLYGSPVSDKGCNQSINVGVGHVGVGEGGGM